MMCPLNEIESLDLSKKDPAYHESIIYKYIKKNTYGPLLLRIWHWTFTQNDTELLTSVLSTNTVTA